MLAVPPRCFPGVFIEADLEDQNQTQTLAKDLGARGNVLGIVNNVGLAKQETFDDVQPNVFTAIMDLNVRPALQLTQALLPGMRAARFGRIINVTSLVTRGFAFRSSYVAAKAALESLTRTMAVELAADSITANAIAPGPTETELFRANNPPGNLVFPPPRRRLSARISSLVIGLPRISGGSAPALPFSRPAQFTLVTSCMLAKSPSDLHPSKLTSGRLIAHGSSCRQRRGYL
ncbi:MAG: short chain dehydrogenase [Acidobacteriaceae bacterium]|nr:short chain dehydrogenase [Acidobacteriaceae bacterium]